MIRSFSRLPVPAPKIITSDYTAISGDLIEADTSGGTFTITLPSSPADGDRIRVNDPADEWGFNNLIIAAAADQAFEDGGDTLTLIEPGEFDLVYYEGVWRRRPRPADQASSLRAVAAGPAFAESGLNPGAGYHFVGRLPIVFGRGCTTADIRLAFDNWYFGSGGVLTVPAGELVIDELYFEYNGRVASIGPVDLPAGAIKVFSLSRDATPYGSQFLEGTMGWIRLHGVVQAGGRIPVGHPATYSGIQGNALFCYYEAANHIDQVNAVGNMTLPTGATATDFGLGPSVVLGVPSDPDAFAIIGIGDSIMATQNDDVSPTDCITGPAFFSRSLVGPDNDLTEALAGSKFAKSGATMEDLTANRALRSYLPYFNAAFIEPGRNDFGASGASRTAAQVLDTLDTLHGYLRQAGIDKIFQQVLFPNTSSTDDHVANQTYVGNWGDGGSSNTKTYLDALVEYFAAGEISVLLPTSTVRLATDRRRWNMDGVTPDWMTDDGIHMTPAAHILVAADCRRAYDLADLPYPVSAYAIANSANPSDATMDKILAFLTACQAANISLEKAWWLSAPTEENSLIELTEPGSYTFLKDGTPTFLGGTGWTGNDTDGKLTTAWSPSLCTKASLSSISLIWKGISNVQDSSYALATTSATASARNFGILPRNGSDLASMRINDQSTATFSCSNSTGVFIANRIGNDKELFRDGTSIGTETLAPTSLTTAPLRVLQGLLTSDWYSGGGSFVGVAAGLSDDQVDALTAAVDVLTA